MQHGYPDLPVPYILGTTISGNDRPLVPNIYRELEDEGYRFQIHPPQKISMRFPVVFSITDQKLG